MTENEIEEAANTLRGADAMAQIKSAQDFDTAYEIKPDRKTRLRFRVNGKGLRPRCGRRRPGDPYDATGNLAPGPATG
ncbi:hypothetical protein ACFQY5_41435 [Paeniroseomonas aquatica]|uniref:hypothetical protein n=1 Tax=Paeniroseomonas aquatica TaxID=373043 RepID=UPI00362432C2